MNKQKALLFIVYFLGIISSFPFIATKSDSLMKTLTYPSSLYGDLYHLSKVKLFKLKLPEKLPESGLVDRVPKDHQILMVGDSFLNVSHGFDSLPNAIAKRLKKNVYYTPQNSSNPFYALKEHSVLKSIQKKFFILESAERNIVSLWEFPFDPNPNLQNQNQSSFKKKLLFFKTRLFDTEKNYRALLDRNPFCFFVFEKINTWLFDSFNYISSKTLAYSLNPPLLFYKKDIDSFNTPHSQELILKIASSLAQTARKLSENYNIELIILPIPSKYTIYHSATKSKRYDLFLPRLCKELKKQGVKTVDLYSLYKKEPDLLYFSSDTHWNEKGVKKAEEALIKLIE